ncbi:hypothetical protein DB346_13610 [Verrucomicrobia bacterium LW23]|nr:hypothetical protein DB346_13610 [Verrucomicrobia bacterium LW23]
MSASTPKLPQSIHPSNEGARIMALRRYEILDTPPDDAFDAITQVVASVLDVPIAIVSLVDTDRIWFKSHHGIDVQQIGRDPGLCASVILNDAPLVLPDARLNPYTVANPLVAGDMGLRFYAGVPLVTHDGFRIGSLCAVDLRPREITQKQLEILRNMGDVVMDQMELRIASRKVHQLNQDLARAKERIEVAVETANVGIWEMEPETGTFIWDEQMHKLYGLRPGEFGGSSAQWLSMLHPEDARLQREAWIHALQKGQTFRGDFRISHPSGKWRWVRSLGRVVPNPCGNGEEALWQTRDFLQKLDSGDPAPRPVLGIHAVGCNWDITEEHEAAEALRESKRAAEAAERAKAEFLAVMSHEIRTPMNAVLGFAELLGATTLQPHQRELLQTVISSGQALLRIIDDTLDFSRIEAGQMPLEHNPFSPGHVVRDVCTLMTPRARQKNISLTWKMEGGAMPNHHAMFLGDAGRLRQVLLNLVSNALKFTEHGEVAIHMQHRGTVPPPATVEAVPAGAQAPAQPPTGADLLEFRVTDTGLGMTPAQLECIFQPFAQADASIARRFGGSGLGLSISHRLVRLMGGSMTATSTPGKGSQFTFTLPLEPMLHPPQPTDAEKAGRPGTREFATQHPQRILVVDDDAINRKLARLFLMNLGYHALVAANGAEALEIYRTDSPDTLLVDEQMPGMSGAELAAAIRRLEEEAGTPRRTYISALTASTQPETREACIAAGMDDFLTKPLRAAGLTETLTKASAHRQKQTGSSPSAAQSAPMYSI